MLRMLANLSQSNSGIICNFRRFLGSGISLVSKCKTYSSSCNMYDPMNVITVCLSASWKCVHKVACGHLYQRDTAVFNSYEVKQHSAIIKQEPRKVSRGLNYMYGLMLIM
jgi:hypothetical protein